MSEYSSDARFSQLCTLAQEKMEKLHIPGVALGVLYDGQEQIAGLGVTSVEHPLPVTTDTLFQVGSITKTFLATAVMRLVEMGRLELDAPLRTHLPDLRLADESVAERVTLRHLLTHTGGWEGDYFNDFGAGEDALAQMVARVADLPQITPLGEIWSYNNAGFYLAGRVIEVVTGKNFEAALHELLLDPLGLQHTFFFPEEVITHRFAVGHEVVDERACVARPWAIGRAVHPAGGIVCNVGELFRYARFQMGDGRLPDGNDPDGERLLRAETLAQMQTPYFPATGLAYIGLSWWIIDVDGVRILRHGGGTNGQIANFIIVPQRQFAMAILTNCDAAGTLSFGLETAALEAYLGVKYPPANPLDLPEAQLAAYAGRYDAAMGLREIRLEEGSLVLQVTPRGGFPTPDAPPPPPPPPMHIALYAEDRAVVLDGPFKDARAEFLRGSDGEIAWLRISGRVHQRI